MADQANEGLLSPMLRRARMTHAVPYLQGKVLDFGCGTGALSQYVPSNLYTGVEQDEGSRLAAQRLYPEHRFESSLPAHEVGFNTIVLLAVIEHVDEPRELVSTLAKLLAPTPSARLVMTTPHPRFAGVHKLGACAGVFSKSANEEHKTLLDKRSLEHLVVNTGLYLSVYKGFLFGANQLAVFAKCKS